MPSAKNPKHLVIVESPAKARTIGRYLGDEYVVEASVGHVMDLPKTGLAVDTENDFEPEYVVIRGKGQVLKKLRSQTRKVDTVLLATDPDREGEAIAYHIALQLGYEKDDGRKFRRVTFNEITRDAVLEAIAQPGDIDVRRVDAQQARRILDRLVGYGLSPLLWKKISPVDPISRKPLSAGRVQSVAVRQTVERERERRAFRAASWWGLEATLAHGGSAFTARLTSVDGRRIPDGKDFDPSTGSLRDGIDAVVLAEEDAAAVAQRLTDAEWTVTAVDDKQVKRNPAAPFTTASLQQEANRKLNLPARQTMRVAQRLYEAGHITYMRTDSTHLSGQAISASRRRIELMYGPEYVNETPRQYATRNRTAQEAHEAIRPAGSRMPTAGELKLEGVEKALFDLIWKRTVATQMAQAIERRMQVSIEADGSEFRANGKHLEFPGFLRAYVEGSDDPDAALEDRDVLLPPLRGGDSLDLRELEATGHETKPPARYTDASLVAALEAEGVGRPSTYAAILSTIVDRGYVQRQGKQLVPTFTAFAVVHLLERHFPDLVDIGFTSDMEGALDAIAEGSIDWREYLRGFYGGEDGFEARLDARESEIDPREASTVRLEDMDVDIRIGRYGPYLEAERDGEAVTASIPPDVPPADLTAEEAEALLQRKAEGPRQVATDPESGLPIFCLSGRFGPYVQLGEQEEGGDKPKRVSLPKGMDPDDLTEAQAIGLIRLPRDLGPHPADGKPVRAGIGRYGPYVVHEKEFRSLSKDEDVLTVELSRALELLAKPKGGRKRSPPKVLRELGTHPDDGEVVRILDGRYGPYVKHGKLNASLPKGTETDEVTLEQALELLAARAARGGAKGRGRGKR